MDINSLLAQLNIGGGNKDTVYMSVTPGVGLELMQLDISAKSVKNYAYRPLEYKDSVRAIHDINEFKKAVSELFDELKINYKSNVVLNMPLVLLGNKELPVLLDDDAVTEALTSEVEQSYIFKRYEPKVAWHDISNAESGEMRRLMYSAIQTNVVEDIKNALTELGATLVGVETSLISLIKGMAFSGLLNEQLKDGISWNLMLITQNGYSICSMVGKNIIEYYEEPLAIKSFENDEIYNAINASAQIALLSYPANYLYIVSETDLVSAEVLKERLKADGIIEYYENNDFKKQDAIPVNLNILEDVAHKISLEAIGVASGNIEGLPVVFDFVGGARTSSGQQDNPDEIVDVKLGSIEFSISPNSAIKVAAIIAALLIIPSLALFYTIPSLISTKQTKLDEIDNKIQNTQAEIGRIEGIQNSKVDDFDINAEIKRILKSNRTKLMGYTALGDAVPKSLWLTYFYAKGPSQFIIQGEADKVEDIYTFYKNMKDSLIDSKLKLNKLEIKADNDTDVVLSNSSTYKFEISNTSSSEKTSDTSDEKDENKQKNNQN